MNFRELQEKHPRLERRLKNMERQWKDAQMLTDLKEHPGVKRLLDELKARAEAIERRLLSEPPKLLPDMERYAIMREREVWYWLQDTLSLAERNAQKIEKYTEKL